MDMAIVIVNEHDHDETWASAWDMNMDMSTRHGHEHVIETWDKCVRNHFGKLSCCLGTFVMLVFRAT